MEESPAIPHTPKSLTRVQLQERIVNVFAFSFFVFLGEVASNIILSDRAYCSDKRRVSRTDLLLMTCYSKGFSFYTEKKKTTKTREEFGSGSGSGSGSEPDKGSGSGSQTGSEGKEKSGIETSGSHKEKPTKSTSNGASGAGLDQEESGDESPTEQGSGKESSGGYAGGESDDGSFETWKPGNRMKRNKPRESCVTL